MRLTKKSSFIALGLVAILLVLSSTVDWGFKAIANATQTTTQTNIDSETQQKQTTSDEDEPHSALGGIKTFWEFTGFANLFKPERIPLSEVNIKQTDKTIIVTKKTNPSIILAEGSSKYIVIEGDEVVDYTNKSFDGRNLIMIAVGLFFIFLAIKYDYEPLLLIPIGVGIILGNIPFLAGYKIGVYEEGSVLNYLYFGVKQGIYPPLIFLGIGAMTDFSSLISNPKLFLLGAAAQVGIFATFLGAMYLGFDLKESGAIAIIGGADGPTAIFLSSKLAPHLMGAIAIAAYSYMALVPVIQPPIMRLLIPKKERLIKMKPPRAVSKTEKMIFPIAGLLLTNFIAPSALPLLGMLFFGNLLKESGVTERLADTARNALINIITILLGVTVGASTQADVFLTADSIKIFGLGALSFIVATAGGLIFARIMNIFHSKDNKLNPLIGAAGVSAVPDSARVVQIEGIKNDPNNHLLMHAMAPNVAGVIGSAVGAGILLSMLS